MIVATLITGTLLIVSGRLAAIPSEFWLSIMLSVVTGVVLAVVFGKRRDLLHNWESVMPPLWIGVVAGLLAVICQAFGVVFARPVMAVR